MSDSTADTTADDLWVFAYGSLMWQPGFEYAEKCRARLSGYHRAFCIYAWTYRGTPKNPGLVLGLDMGGSCTGYAYRVHKEHQKYVMTYLDEREVPALNSPGVSIDVYIKKSLSLRLVQPMGASRTVNAVCYVADPRHPQYTGKLSSAEQVELIRQGQGTRGSSREYLENTIRHMDELGIADGPLHQLWTDVQNLR